MRERGVASRQGTSADTDAGALGLLRRQAAAETVATLQRTIGNRATCRLLARDPRRRPTRPAGPRGTPANPRALDTRVLDAADLQMVEPSNPRSRRAAEELYRQLRAAHGNREIGLVRNIDTGEWVVLQGAADQVGFNETEATALLGARARGRWELVRHVHPPAGGSESQVLRRMPSDVDFRQLFGEWLRRGDGRPIERQLDVTLPEGRETRVRYGIDPSRPDAPWWVELLDDEGRRLPRERFASMERYHVRINALGAGVRLTPAPAVRGRWPIILEREAQAAAAAGEPARNASPPPLPEGARRVRRSPPPLPSPRGAEAEGTGMGYREATVPPPPSGEPRYAEPARIEYRVVSAEALADGERRITLSYRLMTERGAGGAAAGEVRFVLGRAATIRGVTGTGGASGTTARAVAAHATQGFTRGGLTLRAGARWLGPALFLASAAAEIADNPGEAARIVTEATGGYLAGEGATALCVLLAAPTGWGVVGCAIGGAVVGGAIGSTVAGSAYDRARHFPSVVPGSMMAGGGLHGQMRRDEERTREQFHAPGTTSGGARPPFRDAPEPIASPLTGSVEIDRREARNRIAQLSDDARAALARGLLPLQVRPLVPAGRDARTVEQWARAALEGAGYRLELQPPRQEPQGYGAGMELGFRSRGAAAEAAELQLHTAAPVAAPSPPAEGPETIGRGAH